MAVTDTITFTYTLTDDTGGTQSFTGNDNCAQLATFIHNGIADNLKTATLSGNGCGDAVTVDDYGLFDYCTKLTSVDLSNFNTTNVTSMRWMFDFCSKLKSIDVSNFDTSNVTDMYGMFCMCGVSTLDVSSFDVSEVTDTGVMFRGCASLTTIYCNNDWNLPSITSSADMFTMSARLVGAIPYDSTKIDIHYANPTTGYFTYVPIKFNGNLITEIYFNRTKINALFFNGQQLYPAETEMTFAECEAFVQAAFGGTANIRSGYSLHLYQFETEDPRTGEASYNGAISNSSTTESIIFLYVVKKASLGITYEYGSWYDISDIVNNTSLVDYSKLHEL